MESTGYQDMRPSGAILFQAKYGLVAFLRFWYGMIGEGTHGILCLKLTFIQALSYSSGYHFFLYFYMEGMHYILLRMYWVCIFPGFFHVYTKCTIIQPGRKLELISCVEAKRVQIINPTLAHTHERIRVRTEMACKEFYRLFVYIILNNAVSRSV